VNRAGIVVADGAGQLSIPIQQRNTVIALIVGSLSLNANPLAGKVKVKQYESVIGLVPAARNILNFSARLARSL
jgi:hypothetical protein